MDAAQLRERVDLHDLCHKLGIQKGKSGNYRAPWRDDKKASLSIFGEGRKWKDHADGDKGGSCIDLVMHARSVAMPEAMSLLHDLYGFARDLPQTPAQTQPESTEQYVWRQAKSSPKLSEAKTYLIERRKLPKEWVERWAGKAFGYSDWSPSGEGKNPAEYGPAIVFPVHDAHGQAVGVNQRYLADDHPIKMRMLGGASGGFYRPDAATLRKPVLTLVESPIDALTLTAAGCPAIAFLSASMIGSLPLSWLNDTQRLMILADDDDAGRKAANGLYHRALSQGITVQMAGWASAWAVARKDPNDALQAGESLEAIKEAARSADRALFPAGAPFVPAGEFGRSKGYLCDLDSMHFQKSVRIDGDDHTIEEPMAGFRVYRIDPITIHDPETALASVAYGHAATRSVVTYRRAESDYMQQAVIDAKDMGDPRKWRTLGHVHNSKQLALAMQTLSRDRNNQQESVDVIGLVRVGERIRVNDGESAFLDAERCLYHRWRAPSGPIADAAMTVRQMRSLLKGDLGLFLLAWHLGAFLKAFIGFWPHLAISAHAGSGKTTIVEIMRSLTGAISVEPSELSTGYRAMKSLSNHALPIYFDEISRAKPQPLSNFLDLLNVAYRQERRNHGSASTAFLLAGSACMIGQDNPTDDAALASKVIQFDIDGAKGGAIRPQAPVSGARMGGVSGVQMEPGERP
ncbi:toprim domain-containing protein [Magnetofaba australis]|uniref:Putative zinc finger CHC2-family protein n=1 Tax=Magnetofaba australis IT-1 TaxID=1434232 RepID=A0A1Y2K7M4_9PROT|nr:toprim domain-containing protein [Magnetofaba australis]OSM06758.1 putative zinc finger CHC2-family protein [Magnetofaba australis IT-1]